MHYSLFDCECTWVYAQKQLFAYANYEYVSEADAGWLASGLARVSCAFIRSDGVQLGTLRVVFW